MSAPRRGPSRKRDRVTIYEVAERAGVSVATVSKALNRPDTVAAATRERVLRLVDELGFTPGGTGARPETRRIGVIASFSAYQSYLSRLVGIVAACGASGIEVLVFDDDGRTTLEAQVAALATPGRLDGLIVMGAAPDEASTDLLLRRGLPTVLVDAESTAFTSVTIADALGGALVADHLVAGGATRIVFAAPLPADTTHVTSGERRLRGAREALGDRPFEWVVCADTVAGGQTAAGEIAAMRPRPDAIIAVHDVLAAGLVRGFAALGVAVPEEIAVVGYDDADIAAALDLTTVRQPFEQSGVVAAKALIELLDNPAAPIQHTQLIPELVVRATAPAVPSDERNDEEAAE